MKFIKWIGTVIEDKAGDVSAKRVGFFICLAILYKAMGQPEANELVVWTVALLAFGCIGLTVPEWFSKIGKLK